MVEVNALFQLSPTTTGLSFKFSVLSLCSPNRKLALNSLFIDSVILFVVAKLENWKIVFAYVCLLFGCFTWVTIDLVTSVMSPKGPALLPFSIRENVL